MYFLNATEAQSICHHETLATVNLGGHYATGCGPPRPVDLLPFGLIAGALFWPDLGEVGIGGVLTLKRRMERQEVRQEEVEASVVGMRQSLTQAQATFAAQAQSLTAAQTFNITTTPLSAPDQGELHESIAEKKQALEAEGEPEESEGEGPGRTEAEALGEFVQGYARLAPFLPAPGLPRFEKRLDEYSESQRKWIIAWNKRFAREIEALRRTRNLAVHEPHWVGTKTLEEASENARFLSEILFERLEQEPGPEERPAPSG